MKRGWNYEADETGLGMTVGHRVSAYKSNAAQQFRTGSEYHIPTETHMELFQGQSFRTKQNKTKACQEKFLFKPLQCPVICPAAGRTGYASTSSELPFFYCFLSQPYLRLMFFKFNFGVASNSNLSIRYSASCFFYELPTSLQKSTE